MGFAIVQDTFSPKIGRLRMSLKSPQVRQRFLISWGAQIRKRAILNARAKGGRKLWREIANSVNLKRVTDNEVEVKATHRAAAQKQFGGKIRARGKAAGGADALTIPIAPEAEGQSAAKFALAGLHLFVFPNSNLLGYMEEDSFYPLFALVKETKPQRADPWWPEPEFVEDQGVKEAERMLGFK